MDAARALPSARPCPFLGQYPKGRTSTDSTVFSTQSRELGAPVPWLSHLLQLHGVPVKETWGSPLKEGDCRPALGDSQGTFWADLNHQQAPAKLFPQTEHKAARCFSCTSRSRVLDTQAQEPWLEARGGCRGTHHPTMFLQQRLWGRSARPFEEQSRAFAPSPFPPPVSASCPSPFKLSGPLLENKILIAA